MLTSQAVVTLRSLFLLAVGLALLAPFAVSRADVPGLFAPPPDWKPTHAPPLARYTGSADCESCHKAQASSHAHTGMRGAASTGGECDILRDNPRLELRSGPYRYLIERTGDRSVYSVTDGAKTIASPVLWCFGKGEAGQTYVLERNGTFHESRVSYYLARKGLDYTMGAPRTEAASLEEAFGRPMDPGDARACFACHNTAAVSAGRLQPEKMTTGVTCEGCHGPASPDAPPGPRAKACPKGRSGCTTCHMPRFEIPGAHFEFTDHFIRVVRPGEPYPG